MNEQFNWKGHIDKFSNRFSRTIGVLNRLKRLLPLNIKIILYNPLILPNFGVTAWGYKYDRIQKLQKKLVRIISVRKYNAHTEPVFISLKLLKIEHIVKLHEQKLYYKFAHNKLLFTFKMYRFIRTTAFTVLTHVDNTTYTQSEFNTNLRNKVSDKPCHINQ